MTIISTIVPVFIIIFLGLFAKQKKFITPDFLNQANRLVYYIAIPAMIFSSISKSDLTRQMNHQVIIITLVSLMAIAALTYIMAKEMGGDPDFAVAGISICTLVSSVTYGVWLSLGQ